jgi:sodium-dependent phosphate cotransporter
MGGVRRWEGFRRLGIRRGIWGAGGLFFFLLALVMMRDGASRLAPPLLSSGGPLSPGRSLGLGWLMACLALSGSPVAAAAVSMQDAHLLSPAATLTMLTGSRLGASFVLFLIGWSYALRGGHRRNSLTAGFVTFWVTATTYFPATALGLLLLAYTPIRWVPVRLPMDLPSPLSPVRALAAAVEQALQGGLGRLAGRPVPEEVVGGSLFLLGFFLIGLALQALDRAIPLPVLRSPGDDPPDDSPWPMFRVGLAVTALTMSVSVSIGLLVPSVARGWIRRERLIPYVMGANISTFVDTLFAALMLGNPAAAGVVLTEILSVGWISLGILALGYASYCRLLAAVFEGGLRHPLLLGFFLAAFLGVPLLLLALG